MTKLKKVSAINYLNSLPFVYGLQHSPIKDEISLELDIPSVCAEKLIRGEVSIGLVPVAIIPQLETPFLFCDYCIGAVGRVDSVMLYSDVPLEKIESIWLDFHSRTSVNLVKVLAREYWQINPAYLKADEDYIPLIQNTQAGVVIGDRTFKIKGKFAYEYDLSEEWYKFTNLPFVFGTWVSTEKLSTSFVISFNEAMQNGLKNIDKLILDSQEKYGNRVDVGNYLKNKIDYPFDSAKKEGLALFLQKMKNLGL